MEDAFLGVGGEAFRQIRDRSALVCDGEVLRKEVLCGVVAVGDTRRLEGVSDDGGVRSFLLGDPKYSSRVDLYLVGSLDHDVLEVHGVRSRHEGPHPH